MSVIVAAAMLATGVLGFYGGCLWRMDKAEAVEDKARAVMAVARGRHAESWARARPGTGELIALYGRAE